MSGAPQPKAAEAAREIRLAVLAVGEPVSGPDGVVIPLTLFDDGRASLLIPHPPTARALARACHALAALRRTDRRAARVKKLQATRAKWARIRDEGRQRAAARDAERARRATQAPANPPPCCAEEGKAVES